MDEEEASLTDNAGLKRKLFATTASASTSNARETFQFPHALKALARRRISTNKSFDIIREQQKKDESVDRPQKPALSEAARCGDSKTTFDGHALTMICPKYTAFSALAYLLDDALDEVSNLSSEKLPLISVELDHREGKIIIFDTSKGFEGVSISKWGASSNRKSESQGTCHLQNKDVNTISYGVISAGLYLGGRIVVSSRTTASTDVATLQLSRGAWECGNPITVRKELGETRTATEEEENNSPHGSFRLVEISDLRPEATEWNIEELRQKLKDLFFPYVQGNCTSTGSPTKPITIMAMGLNLASIEGGQTTIMKSLSSDREPFIVNLHLTDSADGSTGNATITFHYLPLTKGKESMEILQERLNEENLKIFGESYKSERFSRVTVRWRGRLLMAEDWRTLSFLEGCKDLTSLQRQCYNRVIAFIDTDSGFMTTPSKMSLAAEHCFTKSLMACLLSLENDSTSRVTVDASIQGQGWPLTPQMLGLEYHNWIQDCHRKHDTNELIGDDQSMRIRQTCVTKPHNKLEMGITHTEFQVVWSMKIQGLQLNSRDPQPIRLKLVKQNAPQLLFTLECFICSGSQDTSGATYIICRPIHVPKEQGSMIVDGPDPTFYLRESKIFPLDESFRKKFNKVDEVTWASFEDKHFGDNPAFVELLNKMEMREFGLDGVIQSNSSVEAGFKLPKEILAVVRPRSCSRATQRTSFCRTEQKTIVSGTMEMSFEVRFINEYISDKVALTEEQVTKSKTVFTCTNKACTRNGVQGLYSFTTDATDLKTLFTTTGTYLLAFSVVTETHRNVAPAVARINVSACEEVENWQLCSHPDACFRHPNHWKLKNLVTRIGEVIEEPLYLSGYDVYNNRVALSSVPEELHLRVGQLDGEFLDLSVAIPRERINLCADKSALELKGIEVLGGSLTKIAPTYAAHLWILIHNFPVASYRLTVYPGEPASVALTECDRLDHCLRPGQIIEKFIIQANDDFRNVVEIGREICFRLEGLQLLDKRGLKRQVAEQGCVNLGGLLKVTAEYNAKGTIAILSDKGRPLLALNFHTVYRVLRFLKDPGEAYAGSQLQGLEVQVVDEKGDVDKRMDGSLHSLTLDWNSKAPVPLTLGVGKLPAIDLPVVPGTWRGRVSHAAHPELFTFLEVEVVQKFSANKSTLPAPVLPGASTVSPPQQSMQLNWNVKKEIESEGTEISPMREDYQRQLKDFIERNTKMQRKLREQGRKVKRAEEELGVLKQTKKEVDDVEALWKEELKAFESEAKAITNAQRDAKVSSPSSKSINTAPQVIEILQKQGDPPGTHAASVLLDAVVNDSNVFATGGAGSDILGIVALLACVDNDHLNRALVDYLGIEKMLMIVCRSEKGLKYLQKSEWSEADDLTLHAFARSRNRSISGTFRVLILNEASFYKRNDGLPCVDKKHPQKLLLIPDPGPKHKPRPKGYLGYAVNLLRFNPQQLECYATPAKHGLRESLFFQLFSYLQVYDTKENMLAAQEFHITGAVSLDGGLIHAKSYLEHVLG
ncbi:hypothetical protein M758_3G044500 [Ceratodon purpureus]|nr:hypothetical protein M758_3G044500 [Ceratodon purpureus]